MKNVSGTFIDPENKEVGKTTKMYEKVAKSRKN